MLSPGLCPTAPTAPTALSAPVACTLGRRRCSKQAHSDENDVGCLDGDICACPDGDANVRLGQGRGVVDPVPHHGHFLPFLLELPDLGHLVRRQHLRKDFVDAHLKGEQRSKNKYMTTQPVLAKDRESQETQESSCPPASRSKQ